LSHVAFSWATQSFYPPLYIAACPSGAGGSNGRGLDILFIYDLIRRGWTICRVPNATNIAGAQVPISVGCLAANLTRGIAPQVEAGIYTADGLGTSTQNGRIYAGFTITNPDNDVSSITPDSGFGLTSPTGDVKAVPWSFTTKTFFNPNQMEPSFWRRAHVNAAGTPGESFTVTPIVDGVTRFPQRFIIAGQGTTITETVYPVDILETAHTVQLQVAGSGRIYIRGIDFQVMPKPSTKYLSRK